MARISEYENANSIKAASVIDAMLKNSMFTVRDIESFQQRYGISNVELSRLSGHSTTQISDWKNGKMEMPIRVQQHFTILFNEFKKQFGE